MQLLPCGCSLFFVETVWTLRHFSHLSHNSNTTRGNGIHCRD